MQREKRIDEKRENNSRLTSTTTTTKATEKVHWIWSMFIIIIVRQMQQVCKYFCLSSSIVERKIKIHTKNMRNISCCWLPLPWLGILQRCFFLSIARRIHGKKIIEHAIRNWQHRIAIQYIIQVIKCARMEINRLNSTLNSIVYRISNEAIMVAHCTQEWDRKKK